MDVAAEIESIASPTLSEKGRAAMNQFVKEMATSCFIYAVNLINTAQEQKLGFGENIRAKVDLVLSDPLYNVRRDQTDDDAE